MPVQHDPDGLEIKYLHEVAGLAEARVIEIGCGDGRLTWHYAATAGSVAAIDPNPIRLATAYEACPPTLRSRLTFVQAQAQSLPFGPATFEVALMAWSF